MAAHLALPAASAGLPLRDRSINRAAPIALLDAAVSNSAHVGVRPSNRTSCTGLLIFASAINCNQLHLRRNQLQRLALRKVKAELRIALRQYRILVYHANGLHDRHNVKRRAPASAVWLSAIAYVSHVVDLKCALENTAVFYLGIRVVCILCRLKRLAVTTRCGDTRNIGQHHVITCTIPGLLHDG
jgi:hypothetical protein